jgi:LytS/YehU family sensor histidine kinase
MLSNDQKPLVKVGEEVEFANMYIDLLRERFTEGIGFEIDVDEACAKRLVVPCALQLLVENATKHNIVSVDSPLVVRIGVEGDFLVVRNNLQVRTHGQPSTRLGLDNIRRQYLDITGRDIVVQKTDNEFVVKLPII